MRMHGPRASVAIRRTSWLGELGMAMIAFFFVSGLLYPAGGCAEEFIGPEIRVTQTSSAKEPGEEHAKVVVIDANDNMDKTVRQPKEDADARSFGGIGVNPDILVEDSSDITIMNIKLMDEASLRDAMAVLIRERDELRRVNEDLNSFLRYNMENVSAVMREMEELKTSTRKLREETVQQMRYEAKRVYGPDSEKARGLMDSITLRESIRVMYIIYRTPFELLRYHWRFYSRVEEAVVHMVKTDIPIIANKCSQFYNDVVLVAVDRIFNLCVTHLETLFSIHMEVEVRYNTLKYDLESYMKDKHNMDSELFLTQQEYDWSLKGLGLLLYPKSGHRHCMYWWYAISKDWATVIKENRTVPEQLLAIYANKIRRLFYRIEIYVLWLACLIMFFCLNQEKYIEAMYKVDSAVSGILGWLVVSPCTVDEVWNAARDAVNHTMHWLDGNLVVFYIHLTTIYPNFAFVYPESVNERMGMLVAIVVLVSAFFVSIKYAARGIIKIIKLLLFGGKRYKSAYNGYDKVQSWYNGSFIRWSFNLLQPEQNTAKPQSPPKIRRKVKYLYSHPSFDDTNTGNPKRLVEQTHKTNTYWHSVSCRNRGRDTVVVNEPAKDK